MHKFETFADPGPVDNRDFLCQHGGMSFNFILLRAVAVKVEGNWG